MSKKRNSTFSFAKRSGSPSLWAKYHSYHNKTLAYLRHLKSKFFYNLLTSPSLRSFWSAVKCICSKPVSIPSLIYNGSPVTSSYSKEDVLSQYFSFCFNMSTASLPPLALSLIFNSSLSTGIFPSDWKNFNIVPIPKSKILLHSLQTIAQSLYFHSQVRFWNVTSLTIYTNFVLLTISFQIVSLVFDQDSRLKLILSIVNSWFFYWIAKM